MFDVLIRIAVVAGSCILWLAGLRLFLQTDSSRGRKLGWTALLLLVGIAIGVVLPSSQVWSKFLWLIAILPVLGLADVWLLRSGRGLSYWIRACGFEVCTVFGAAAAARYVLDLLGAAPLLPTVQ
ncbi:MAG: hypothetical protein WA208_00345 [Thermoanaerobaculia bacterium]